MDGPTMADLDPHARDVAEATGHGYEYAMVQLQQLAQVGIDPERGAQLIIGTATFWEQMVPWFDAWTRAMTELHKTLMAHIDVFAQFMDPDAAPPSAPVCRRGHGRLTGGRCRVCDR